MALCCHLNKKSLIRNIGSNSQFVLNYEKVNDHNQTLNIEPMAVSIFSVFAYTDDINI